MRGIQKAIKSLEKAGLIKSDTRGSSVGTNEYTITSKLVREPQFDKRNSSSSSSSTQSRSPVRLESSNSSSCKEDNLNNIYYNNKGNIIEYINVNGVNINPTELFNSIIDEPNNFYFTHSESDIESIKKIIQTIDNPDSLVSTAVKVLISFRNW